MKWFWDLLGIREHKPITLSKDKLNAIAEELYGMDEPFLLLDDKYYVDSCELLQILSAAELIWMNGSNVYVNANDIFIWGCGDGELLTSDELEKLVIMHLSDTCWGVAKWVCMQRNMQPQYPIKRDMKKNGYWDCELDNLPINPFD